MRKISLTLASLSLAAAMAPTFAGNYAEGDPRPGSQPNQLSIAQVQNETRQWMASAPTAGYPEGNPRAVVHAGQKTRAQVQAEAIAWTKSGMSEIAYGEIASDSRGPSYDRALQAFNELNAGNRAAAAPGATPAVR